MSSPAATGSAPAPAHDHGHGHGHHKFQAHHFDSMDQQFESGKFGVWLFLVTEILFFSGLFCAYIVYRALHPEIFLFAHMFLNKYLGALNTAVLIFSSFTMAWAVRNAQKGQKGLLCLNLAITILCGCTFMVVKYFEYTHKFHMGLKWGVAYAPNEEVEEHREKEHAAELARQGIIEKEGEEGEVKKKVKNIPKLSGTGVRPLITNEPPNVHIFFSIYYCMTGLHGIHVVIGIGILIWTLLRAMKGHFGPDYFFPVDYVGLYWHLVDLIWIYLFPLLYLIH
jgi:cytochrome c oxidase subunit 3